MIKRALFLFAILVGCTLCSPPSGSAEYRPDRRTWTGNDTFFEAIFGVLLYLDWKQTIEFTQNPHEYPDCHETNVFLGGHPTRERINLVVAASFVGHAAIAYALPQPYRGWWQWVWIGIEGDVVHTNYVVTGVSVRF